MVNEEIIEKARKFIENECRKESSKYGFEPYEFHFVKMHARAKEMAEQLGADVESVRIAAWLHDVGSIIYGRENHHITGAKIAGEKLKEWGYAEDKIEAVKKCILNHRGSTPGKKESAEEIIIADADAMSNFDNIGGIFKAAFMEGKNQIEAVEYALDKLVKCYNKLSLNGKNILQDKYDAVVKTFSSRKGA